MEEEKELEFTQEEKNMMFKYGGAIVGFIFVKLFVFSMVEDMGWSFFWSAMFDGTISFEGLLKVIQTSGFIKLVIGSVAGYKIGELVENGTIKKWIEDYTNDKKEDK